MARKTKPVVIDEGKTKEESRDADKVFFITEMPAVQGDAWAKRALLALSRVNFDLNALGNIENLGMEGVAALGAQFLSSLKWEDAEPLLAELLACVQAVRDPKNTNLRVPLNQGSYEDIEEISTISKLQMEVFQLHVNFSTLAGHLKSKLGTAAAQASQSTQT